MFNSNNMFKNLFLLGVACLFSAILSGTAIACRMYGVVSENLPDGILQNHLVDAANSLKNLAISGNVDGWGIAYYPNILVDSSFDASLDSADLRANGTGQDWYERIDSKL